MIYDLFVKNCPCWRATKASGKARTLSWIPPEIFLSNWEVDENNIVLTWYYKTIPRIRCMN
jgi:hypothetical protein